MRFKVASTLAARLKGLYGCDDPNVVLLLVPCNDIHTLAMKHDIDVAFVAPDGTVIESHRNVKPNRRLRNRAASATLERIAGAGEWPAPGSKVLYPNDPTRGRAARCAHAAPAKTR